MELHSFQAQYLPGNLPLEQLGLHLLRHVRRDPSASWLLEDGKKPSEGMRTVVNKSNQTIYTWEEERRKRQANPKVSLAKSYLGLNSSLLGDYQKLEHRVGAFSSCTLHLYGNSLSKSMDSFSLKAGLSLFVYCLNLKSLLQTFPFVSEKKRFF